MEQKISVSGTPKWVVTWGNFLRLQSSCFIIALPFVEHSLAFLLAPMGSVSGNDLSHAFDKFTVHGGRAAGWGAWDSSNLCLHLWLILIRKPLRWQVAGPGWGWCFLDHICFSWPEARAKVSREHSQRKLTIFACFAFLFFLIKLWTVSGLRISKSNNSHNQENMLVRPVSWACKLAGPPEVVVSDSCVHADCVLSPSVSLPFPSWLPQWRPGIGGCSELKTQDEKRCDSIVFSISWKQKQKSRLVDHSSEAKKEKCWYGACVLRDVMLWPIVCHALL